MATKTRAEIRARTRFLGSYENSTKFTDALVNDELQAGLNELYALMADSNEGYFDTKTTTPTVVNQDYVDLPVDFWRLRGVDVSIGGRYRELRQVGIADRNKFQSTAGRPAAYRTVSGGARGRLELYPTPNSVETLRLIYTPTCPVWTDDSDTFEFYGGNEDYVITAGLLRLDQREERPLGERQQELERIRQRVVRDVSMRRAAEPEYLVNRTTYFDDWEGDV